MLHLYDPLCVNDPAGLEAAYEQCRQITARYSKTFYLGTLLMSPSKRRAIWAIYVWCRRTDELVDGPAAQNTTAETLDAWESRLEDIFAGRPKDSLDLALTDTLRQFPQDIQPFRDMIAGQRMDLYRSRYNTFEELHLYCYRVAGTVGLISTAVMGIADPSPVVPWSRDHTPLIPQREAVALGIANQLTNILRDVGEDARRGRIYLPLEDLKLFNYPEADLLAGVVDERWQSLMQFQIQRARKFYAEAEQGICALSEDARWPVWAALMLYSRILDQIERNQYDVFRYRAYVPGLQKILCLPTALLRARVL